VGDEESGARKPQKEGMGQKNTNLIADRTETKKKNGGLMPISKSESKNPGRHFIQVTQLDFVQTGKKMHTGTG